MPTEVLLALVGLGGTLAGGVGLELVKRVFVPADKRLDDQTAFRAELRSEVTGLREELRKVEGELDRERTRYFELLAEYHKLKAENHAIRADNHDLRQQMTILKLQVDRLQRTINGSPEPELKASEENLQ